MDRFEEPQVIATYAKDELEKAIRPQLWFNGYDGNCDWPR